MKSFILILLILGITLAEDPFAGEDYDAGLIEIAEGDELFYWLIRSRGDKNKDPLVIWLNGGPGSASELGLFYENGPWKINDDLTLRRNDHSWNELANVLYLDQPIDVGFSKTDDYDHIPINEDEIADDFYTFMTLFMEKFPEYKGRDFYITGESYAGHYIPAMTARIIEKNNSDINIIASAIGNGWVYPRLQYQEYRTFAVENDLVNVFHNYLLKAGFWFCDVLIRNSFTLAAFKHCEYVTDTVVGNPPSFNTYDIRDKCENGCYDFSNIGRLLDLEEVREAINMDDRQYQRSSSRVFTKMREDQIDNLSPSVRYSLDNGVGMFIYSGDKDYICNWRGGEAWTNEIFWDGQQRFRSAQYETWSVNGTAAGEYKQVGQFTFLKFFDAGHLVPMDQPKHALEMFRKFLAREF
ncbi:unnamed protein product [Moneuplotes crassus]|uniref:Carboxypeptidase n=2 Tax=Euplotes crassus TaxID=5936 RepID=A0AAD1UPP2_EUPCR|nr:unnamed protein product [Moneuplotes crassus]